VSAADEITAGRTLLDQANRARAAFAGPIEDLPPDGALVAGALEHFRRGTDKARAAGSAGDEALAWLARAEAQMLLPRNMENVLAAEEAGRQTLALLDAAGQRAGTLAGYVVLGQALAELATVADVQQRERIEAARGVLEAAEILALQSDDALVLARLRDSLSRVLGERFKGDRDQNLMDAVALGEQALPALRGAHHPDSLELPALLNHLGNCCVKVSTGFRNWVRRGQAHYREGAAATDPLRYPRLRQVLEGNAAMTEGLLAQEATHDALPEKEMVSRFAAATQDAIDAGDVADAQAQAHGFLSWAWSLSKTPNVHIGEAHKMLGRLAMARQSWNEAELHLYESALVLYAVLLPPQHHWAHLKDEALDLLAEAMKHGGRGEFAPAVAAQARQAWGTLRGVLGKAQAAQLDEAGAALDRVLALYPDFPPALMARARGRLNRRELGLALADLNRYLTLRPHDGQALTLRARIRMDIGEGELALADWNALLELNPGDATGLLNRGQLLLHAGRLKEAGRDLDKLLAARQDLPEAFFYRAGCRERLGDAAGAAQDLEHVLPAVAEATRAEIKVRIARLRGRAEG
jgi:tetratricopeptide (TPR) repeat protein